MGLYALYIIQDMHWRRKIRFFTFCAKSTITYCRAQPVSPWSICITEAQFKQTPYNEQASTRVTIHVEICLHPNSRC